MRAMIPTLFLSSVLFAGCAGAGEGNTTGSVKPYTELDDQSSQLREDFNRSKGSVRLLFVVDPTCGGCLRGMDDIDEDLLGKTDDPRLQTFVVQCP